MGAEGRKADLKLVLDFGTGYELFSSLYVLHQPDSFNLPSAWSAGVRSRLSSDVRNLFAQTIPYFGIPLHWVHELPAPKDAAAVLRELDALSVDQILATLVLDEGYPHSLRSIFLRILEGADWEEGDGAEVAQFYRNYNLADKKKLAAWIEWWRKPGEFGELLRQGLLEYYDGFFREEERRILPYLRDGFTAAAGLIQDNPALAVLKELNLAQWRETESAPRREELILVPSFWASQIVLSGILNERQGILLFGVRPASTSVVPGQPIPDNLINPLQALANPTRLRVLKLLCHKPLNQSEIAKKLRLRAPTITHHIRILRRANLLVTAHIDPIGMRFGVRRDSLSELDERLQRFLYESGES